MLKAAILSGCIVGIAASLADISVSGKYRSQIRVIVALILIIVISQPFLRADFDSLVKQYIDDFEGLTIHQSQEALSDNVLDLASENISQYIYAKLTAAGIKPISVSIELTVTEDGLVDVERTNVILEKEQLEFYDDVKRIVSDELLRGTVNITWEDQSA